MSTIETLLIQAYDAEQAGQLAEAARLRTMAREHDSAALAGSTWTGAPARTAEDIDRAQVDAWNRMDADEQLFASVIKKWMDQLPPTHQAMGQAGVILICAACASIGPEDDGDDEQVIAARIHHAAYTQGLADGRKQGVKEMLDLADKLVAEQKQPRKKAA